MDEEEKDEFRGIKSIIEKKQKEKEEKIKELGT